MKDTKGEGVDSVSCIVAGWLKKREEESFSGGLGEKRERKKDRFLTGFTG